MNKPLVYLAGPYSTPDPVENMHNAIWRATTIMGRGTVTPILPHLTGIWHLVTPQPYETWLAYDLEVMARCDAVYRFGGASNGADREVAEAERLGMPVLWSYLEVELWAKEWKGP